MKVKQPSPGADLVFFSTLCFLLRHVQSSPSMGVYRGSHLMAPTHVLSDGRQHSHSEDHITWKWKWMAWPQKEDYTTLLGCPITCNSQPPKKIITMY